MAGAWEVREVQWCIHFYGPYGNSVVCAADALDRADPNGRVCTLNGKQCGEGCHPDPRHMGIHSKGGFSQTQPCCQAGPWDFDLLMNCFIDLHLCLLI